MRPWQLAQMYLYGQRRVGLWPMVDLWPDDLTPIDPDEDDDPLLGYSIHEGLAQWAV